ncbi:unnamed protein product [Urochloa humidicola]
MAAALAKLLRGGRSGTSSAPIPAIYRRGLQEVAGSSSASPHTGQWGNSLPQQRALPFGSRGVLSQEQKLVRMEQLQPLLRGPSTFFRSLKRSYARRSEEVEFEKGNGMGGNNDNHSCGLSGEEIIAPVMIVSLVAE